MPLIDESILLLQRRRRRRPNVVCVNADDAAANIAQVGSNGSINDSFRTFRATTHAHWSYDGFDCAVFDSGTSSYRVL